MYKYVYRGPVYSFGRMITDCWVGETYAVTMKKARSNLFHQCKKHLECQKQQQSVYQEQ